jgi:hypothetical protein
MTEPSVLVCTRTKDMTVMHPDQAWELCSKCQHAVGVYPSGQRAMKEHPEMKIVCSVCVNPFNLPPDAEIISAGTLGEMIQEKRDSKPVGKA